MPVLTELQPCDPPETYRDRAQGPSLPIDCAILRHLEAHPDGEHLAAVRAAVGGSTHYVHARLAALADRGLVHRSPVPGGPRRGPGASVYMLVRTASWTCPS